jgi:hypothetical protein
MAEPVARRELAQKVLIHLYNSAVGGSLRSTAPLLRAKDTSLVKNPRFKDLQALYKLSENNRRLFYAAAIALAEAAVYRTLDFVEMYHRFDSEHNKELYPQLSLIYTTAGPNGLNSTTISEHGTEELGKQFLRLARSQEMRALMESIIDQLAARAETMDRQHKE